ncbi:hypothetical protein, partial [Leptospira borgpetersenii]|uniref:hypothetical protein n=1 Tax=Leptospira borgpetersenii TaxID=174 RepID=UPI001D1519B2
PRFDQPLYNWKIRQRIREDPNGGHKHQRTPKKNKSDYGRKRLCINHSGARLKQSNSKKNAQLTRRS